MVLPQSLRKISSNAFYESGALQTINIPAGVTQIDEEAFQDCTGLKSINVSTENVSYRSIEGSLFSKNMEDLITFCSGKTDRVYTVPDGVKYVRSCAFANCAALQEVHLPDSLKMISSHAFYHTGLQYVKIPHGVEKNRT